MNEFSALHKKTGATARKIQKGRFLIRGDDRVERYRRENYADQDLFELKPIKGLSEDEKAKQIEEYVWIPTYVDLRDIFFGQRKFEAREFKNWQERNPELKEKVNKEFPAADRKNALTLLYVMEEIAKKAWDWDNESWVKMDRGA